MIPSSSRHWRQGIKTEPSYTSTTPRPGFDGEQLKRSLDAAWGSELLLAITGTYAPDELRGVSNTWVAIQTYYACYPATQALIVAKGQPRPTSHPKTQRMFVDMWVSPSRDLAPWSLGASHAGYENVPTGHAVDESVHRGRRSMPRAPSIWPARPSAPPAKTSSRMRRRRSARRSRRRRGRPGTRRKPNGSGKVFGFRGSSASQAPRLTVTEHAAVESRTKPFGLLHYLYRLRIKAQYEDSTLFSEGPETTSDSLLAYRRLEEIVRSTLLLHELYIERVVRRPVLEPLVDDWINRQASSPVNPLAARRKLVLP
jgi:hypothetical protein